MRTQLRRLLASSILVASLALTAIPIALGQANEEIVISDMLKPARLEVASGTVVTWRNEDDERHRVRSRQGPVEFDSGNLEPGERFSVTFVVAGEYPYLDERNDDDPAYFGTIIVTSDEPTGGPPPMAATVTLIDESFQPPTLEVAVGATVTWENIDGDDDHTVTSTEGVFNSGVFSPGSDFAYTFDSPGTYPYFCAIHPEMEGTITVTGSAPEAIPSPAPEAIPSPAPEAPAAVASPDVAAADGEPAHDQPAPASVSIVDLTFAPPVVEVEAGTTVTWTNDDGVPHTVSATEGSFDSGVLMTGDTYSRTFEVPGTYPYFCAIHPSMAGTVVVGDAATPGGAELATPGVVADQTADGASTVTSVSMVDVMFRPADIEVSAGTTVEWINDDPIDHTVTARDGSFDSGVMGASETFSLAFDAPGTYDYFCAIHPSMTGTVTVTVTP